MQVFTIILNKVFQYISLDFNFYEIACVVILGQRYSDNEIA